MSTTNISGSSRIAVAELGELLAPLRLRDAESLRAMQRSMQRHGQMTAATIFADARGGLQIIDGFKRLHAARELGWTTLQVRSLELTEAQAKAVMQALNKQAGLCELEEGWLVRSLHREDGLTQPQIGVLLERHKSWVCRRLMLVELLDETVQGDVRLGLLSPRIAMTLARLPRGNQRAAAEVVTRRGLTTRQAERLCACLLAADEVARPKLLADWEAGRADVERSHSPAPPATPAELILEDISKLCRVAARLQARLLARPLGSVSPEVAATVRSALVGLRAVVDVLQQTAERVSATEMRP